MTVEIKKSFAEEWRDKGRTTSKKLADSRLKEKPARARKANEMLNKMTRAGLSDPSNAAKKPQMSGKTRLEMQDAASRMGAKQSKEFVKNKQSSQSLMKALKGNRAASVKSAAKPSTNRAVVNKGKADQNGVMKQDGGRPAASAAENAERFAAARNVAHNVAVLIRGEAKTGAKRSAETPSQKPQKQLPQKKGDPSFMAKDAAHAENLAKGVQTKMVMPPSPQALQGSVKKDEGSENRRASSDDGDKRSKSKGRGAHGAAGGVGSSSGKSAARDLNAMLGGFAGDGADYDSNLEHEDMDAASDVLTNEDAVRENALPEMDPSFHVYSEFDSENPGVEAVISKAQLYQRHIVKERKLREIGELDERLNERLADVFKDKPLSDRIVGDLKDDITLAKMLNSPYGGGFRG